MTEPSPAPASLFEATARELTSKVVEEIEARTAAELVVCVRGLSGHYKHVDYLCGMVLGFATMVLLLYVPQEIPLEAFPLFVLVAFAAGTSLCANVPAVRRRLVPRVLREESVRLAARAAFYELGVSRTSARTGVLVYVSGLEQRVEVVADVGVDTVSLGTAWDEAVERLNAAAARGDSAEPFLQALRQLGEVLARALPATGDNPNELSNVTQHAA